MTNPFIGKPEPPSDAELAAELGAAHEVWEQIRAEAPLPGEWHSYSKKAGWSMRLKQRDRNIVYLIPGEGEVWAALTLGDRAVAAAKDRGLAKIVEGAKRYAEGTAVRFQVKGPRDVARLKKLIDIKLEF